MAKSLRILIVEDEWLLREDIAGVFRDKGWEVLEANTAEGAISLLESCRALDVLFTDIQLAGALSGWDVADAVRDSHPGTAIVYASGNTIDRRRQAPDSSFFQKPYAAREIVKACGGGKA